MLRPRRAGFTSGILFERCDKLVSQILYKFDQNVFSLYVICRHLLSILLSSLFNQNFLWNLILNGTWVNKFVVTSLLINRSVTEKCSEHSDKTIINGLFGKGGYEHQIFNDHRGTLNAQAYGTRVLGPAGDSSHLGGALNWKNPNAAASFDISKQIHGGTSYQAAAGGRWPVGKNGDFSLQGTYGKQAFMRREYGGLGSFNYR
ncbi:unnamed protein product [Danaus chrysippus]|uniref:(African queen) hypothetical protein n=1 Tax=Danaus chrysippus TaxID=151541 RepID=A0A8J2QSW2_9NEOP|nr:unnamed protein product [Danaus chrysippus]